MSHAPSRSRAPLALLVAVLATLATVGLGAGCASAPPKERERRIRRYEGPVIDLFAHLVVNGIDETDRFKTNAADPRVQKIAAVVDAIPGNPNETRALNDRVLQLARDNKKVVPMPSVYAYDGQIALDELNRVADAGATLVHLAPGSIGIEPADARLLAVVQRAGERGVVLFIEGSSPADPTIFQRTLALAQKYPATPLVILHAGLAQFREAAAIVYASKLPGWGDNVWVDLSATASLYSGSPMAPELVWLVKKMQRRVLFGSGFPLEQTSQGVTAVQGLGLEEGEQADVLFANAARLLKLAN